MAVDDVADDGWVMKWKVVMDWAGRLYCITPLVGSTASVKRVQFSVAFVLIIYTMYWIGIYPKWEFVVVAL